MKMITITRSIQIYPVDKGDYSKIRTWSKIVHRAANLIATHQYVQDQVKDLFYFTEEVKMKLADVKKDESGALTMSRANTTYQALSKEFKGECPMGMLSGLNQVISKTYKEEAFDVKIGRKSLRSYRNDIPLPVRMGDVRYWKKLDSGNYEFAVYGIVFKTRFGRDLSDNQYIMDMAQKGNYKLCDSSIQFKKEKLFLNAVFQFPSTKRDIDPAKKLTAWLDIDYPIKFSMGGADYTIGSAEEFLHRRLQIQAALRRSQIASRFNKGGKGRKKKLKATERYKKAEKNYVQTRIHQYTSKLIDWCLKTKSGTLELLPNEPDSEMLLRNWTYHGMIEKLEYKCKKFGIELKKNGVDQEPEEQELSGIETVCEEVNAEQGVY